MSIRRRFMLLALASGGLVAGLAPRPPAAVLAAAAPAAARAAQREAQDQIVLSGRVDVRRGDVAGEVVVLHGTVSVEGVVRGDVVVVDGRISVFGQVSGSVVDINGPVLLGPNAQVRGDVLAREAVDVRPGAKVGGSIRQGTAFTFRTPVRAVGGFAGWLAVSASTLLLGMLLVGITPRGADAVFEAARSAPWPSVGWGAAAFLGLPVFAVLSLLALVGLPFGLGLLLALAFLYFTGYAWSAWALGRAILKPPGNRAVAFLAGWAILRALALPPFAGGVTWVVGAVFGLGALTVAVWRARRAQGKHREGRGAAAPGRPGLNAGQEPAT